MPPWHVFSPHFLKFANRIATILIYSSMALEYLCKIPGEEWPII
jgi:hypothetical protein